MGVLNWLMTGSVRLFRVFDIEVRIHAAFLVMLVLVLLFGFGPGTPLVTRLQLIGVLWGIVLLHEFGHCFGARWTGGSAHLITLNPLGGLAFAMAANNHRSRIITIAGGPLVNVAICLICGVAIYALSGNVLLTPSGFGRHLPAPGWWATYQWLWLIHATSLALLFFNLLPVFPLDGGQLMQALLWHPMGYYRSMMLTANIGIVGASLMMVWGLLMSGGFGGGLLLFIGLNCLLNCIQMKAMLKQAGPWGFSDEDLSAADASGFDREARKQAKAREASAKRREKLMQQDRAEQQKIDRILAKVSASGMQSLTWLEKRTLAQASKRQQSRERESAKPRHRV
jgi:Zn-dependent protease